MRVYENWEEPDEWSTHHALTLEGMGRFAFTICARCYAGSVTRRVEGRWRQEGRTITLVADASDHDLWPTGAIRTAFEDGEGLKVGDVGLHLPLRLRDG